MLPVRRPAIPALTGARFFAALWVLLLHWNGLYPTDTWFTPVVESGGAGVPFFFVLSGFVLAWNYQGELSLTTDHRKATLRYLLRRFARLYPLYVGCLGAFVLLLVLTNGGAALEKCPEGYDYELALITNVFALQAWVLSVPYQQCFNAPGWSVSAEFFFYLLLPLVLPWLERIAHPMRVVAAISVLGVSAVVLVGWWLHTSGLGSSAGHVGFFHRLPLLNCWTFLLGVSLALMLIRHGERLGGKQLAVLTVMTLVILFGAMYGIKYGLTGSNFSGWLIIVFSPYLIFTPLFGALIYFLSHSENSLAHLLGHRILVFLGESSYALYIVHWIFLAWFNYVSKHILQLNTWIMVTMVATVLLACALHRWVEQPLYKAIVRHMG